MATAFVAPVVAPAYSAVAHASQSESLDQTLTELLNIAEAVKNTDEYERLYDTNTKWLNNARDNGSYMLKNGNNAQKTNAINLLRVELNNPEVRPIVDKVARSLPADFTNFHENPVTTELKQAITVANYVRSTDEHKRLFDTNAKWLYDAWSDAEYQVRNGDILQQEKSLNWLKAELNRKEILPLVNKVNKPLPASFNSYTEPVYHSQLKEVITIANHVRASDAHKRVFNTSSTWLYDAWSNATYEVRNGDGIDQQEALNWLKAELNGYEIRPIVDSLNLTLPSGFSEYTEDETLAELKRHVIYANIVRSDKDYDSLPKASKDSLYDAWNDADYQVRNGDSISRKEALNNLKTVLNNQPVKQITDRAKATYASNSGETIDEIPAPQPTPSPEKPDAATITQMKNAIRDNEYIVKGIEILLGFPSTVDKIAPQLVEQINKSNRLRKQAADYIKKHTGEDIYLMPVKIPARYQHLVK